MHSAGGGLLECWVQARGGLESDYPWGAEAQFEGKHMMNVWQVHTATECSTRLTAQQYSTHATQYSWQCCVVLMDVL